MAPRRLQRAGNVVDVVPGKLEHLVGAVVEHHSSHCQRESARFDAELRNEVGTAVVQATSLRKGFHFSEARALLKQAQEQLGPSGREPLQQELAHARADLDLAQRLDEVRSATLALLAGKFDASDPRPGAAVLNWLWLALADQRLGKSDDARRWLEKAQKRLDQYPDGMPSNAETDYGLHLHNWLEANVLRHEAEAMISSK